MTLGEGLLLAAIVAALALQVIGKRNLSGLALRTWCRLGCQMIRVCSLGTFEPDMDSRKQRVTATIVGAAASAGVLLSFLYSLAP